MFSVYLFVSEEEKEQEKEDAERRITKKLRKMIGDNRPEIESHFVKTRFDLNRAVPNHLAGEGQMR